MTTLPDGITPEFMREYIIAAHFNLEKVKEVLAAHPGLLNLGYEWSPGDVEDALAAASHVGNTAIATYVMMQGAPLTPCAAAMLGYTERLREFLIADPSVATSKGAHSIPILFHAAFSGNTELTDLLLANGGVEGAAFAMHAAVSAGQLPMLRWLLEHGGAADVNILNYEKKTPLAKALEAGQEDMAEVLRAAGGLEAVA
jgi:ankyrin repeat protein